VNIEMTGAEDRQGPWKLAIAGTPGSGKTMFSSTAPEPLFVFFQQDPRIKSVADRSIPHVKIVNDFTSGSYAVDQLQALLMHLQLSDHQFQTLVVDTGDELFQQMKAGRTHQNGGEFGPGDWGWIADAYRELMLSIIDLSMHVIVTFHTKLAVDDDHSFRELMLQGQAKDEAAGWFDIVAALDTFEVTNDDGRSETKRALLTEQSRMYPWVKDHSGALPRRFELSPHITDDFSRVLEIVQSSGTGTSEHQVIAEVAPVAPPPPPVNREIPSPEELDARKHDAHEIPEEPPQEVAAPIDTQDTKAPDVSAEVTTPSGMSIDTDSLTQGEGTVPLESEPADSQQQAESVAPPSSHEAEPAGEDVSDEQAVAELQEQLGAEEAEEEENNPYVCKVCGIAVDDTDLHELTQIRYQEYLCLPHFKEKLNASK